MKDAESVASQIIANFKTGKFLNGYPLPGSQFTKEAMDNRVLLGRGKALPASKKGRVQLGGKVI